MGKPELAVAQIDVLSKSIPKIHLKTIEAAYLANQNQKRQGIGTVQRSAGADAEDTDANLAVLSVGEDKGKTQRLPLWPSCP